MPREKRNRTFEALEALTDAVERRLESAVRVAVETSMADVMVEVRDLRKSVLRLQRAVAQSHEPAPVARGGARRAFKLCCVTGCGRKHAAKGLCKNHYQQWLNRKKKEGPNAPKPGAGRRSRRT